MKLSKNFILIIFIIVCIISWFFYNKPIKALTSEENFALGIKYHTGDGVVQDFHKAKELFELAIVDENPKAKFALGYMYYYGDDVKQDFHKARKLFESLDGNETWDAGAQYFLGLMYLNGDGVRQDSNNALFLFEKSANNNNSQSQYQLGYMFLHGNYVIKNLQISKEWFGKACDNGNQTGCDEYANLNKQGY